MQGLGFLSGGRGSLQSATDADNADGSVVVEQSTNTR